ncbi:MAG: thiol-disulfide isomerase/thioredoxin [Sphingobacteriales bacterium]|jgi:thiol-disulfide isomerase/thioredoxin
MRIQLLLIAFTLLFSNSVLSQTQTGYKIEAQFKGISDTTCLLAYYYADQSKTFVKDTFRIDSKGKCIIESDEDMPWGMYILAPGKNLGFIDLLIDDENRNFSLTADITDLIMTAKFTGSPQNEDLYAYRRFAGKKQETLQPMFEELKKLREEDGDTARINKIRDILTKNEKEIIQFRTDYIKKKPNSFTSQLFTIMGDIDVPDAPVDENGVKDSTFAYRYYKKHYFDGVNFADDRIIRTPVFKNKLERYFDQLVIQIPDSINKDADDLIARIEGQEIFKYVIQHITNEAANSKIMGMDAVYVHMVEKYYNKETAYWLDDTQLIRLNSIAKAKKPTLIGATAPDVTLKDTAGNYRRLHSVNADYTAVYFWDPDCGHCKKATPKMLALFNKMDSLGVSFQVYGVYTENEIPKWKEYIIENNLRWINVEDIDYKTGVKFIYDIKSTPAIFLLDKDKKVIAKQLGAEQLEDFMERLIKKEKG